jgi:putative FmdB family regulatory protein
MPPMYTWQCKTCEAGTEVLRSFDDYKVPPEKCDCGETDPEKFTKVIGKTEFILKGRRWYKTGYQ